MSKERNVPRYYAEYVDSCWRVFDRDGRDPTDHNLCRPIAACADRTSAFKIRDALNDGEKDA